MAEVPMFCSPGGLRLTHGSRSNLCCQAWGGGGRLFRTAAPNPVADSTGWRARGGELGELVSFS